MFDSKSKQLFYCNNIKMKKFLQRFLAHNSGQTLTEYALILAVIAIAVVAVMTLMGEQIQGVFQSITDTLSGTSSEGGEAS